MLEEFKSLKLKFLEKEKTALLKEIAYLEKKLRENEANREQQCKDIYNQLVYNDFNELEEEKGFVEEHFKTKRQLLEKQQDEILQSESAFNMSLDKSILLFKPDMFNYQVNLPTGFEGPDSWESIQDDRIFFLKENISKLESIIEPFAKIVDARKKLLESLDKNTAPFFNKFFESELSYMQSFYNDLSVSGIEELADFFTELKIQFCD